MENYTSYTELDVWKKTIKLVKTIYEITKNFPKEELYSLTNQIRRCATSIPSNIAEGCGRQHTKDSIQFFYIARGSIFELETQLYIALELNFIDKNILDETLVKLVDCKKLINGFINYYKNTNN